MALVERPRPAGDLDQRAGPDGEPRVDPPHERHRLVPDVGQAMAGSDERLAGAELHPALDPERRDDPRAAQLDGDHVRAVGHDPARPGLRPHLAQERELLAADHRRMTGRDDLVDPARPPVVRVRSEDGRPDVEPRMVVQQVTIGGLRHELHDLGPVRRQHRHPDAVVLEHDGREPAVGPAHR